MTRARSRTGELNVATWNIRSLSLTGRRGFEHAEVLLQECKVLDCDMIGLQKTLRPGWTELAAVDYHMLCSGEKSFNDWMGRGYTDSVPGVSPKQPLPGVGLHDPLHGWQACPELNSVH